MPRGSAPRRRTTKSHSPSNSLSPGTPSGASTASSRRQAEEAARLHTLQVEVWETSLAERLERIHEALGEQERGSDCSDDEHDDNSVEDPSEMMPAENAATPDEDEDAVVESDLMTNACGCASKTNPVRARCIRIMTNRWFDRTVLFLILINAIALAAVDPTAPEPMFIKVAEVLFNTAFTIEMLIKMLALGLVCGAPNAYFCNAWNRLDFITVVFGWLPLLIKASACARGSSHVRLGPISHAPTPVSPQLFAGKGSNLNLSFVRTVRVLKVLKSVQRVEGMRTLVASLLKCAPLLLQVRRPALARCRVDLA